MSVMLEGRVRRLERKVKAKLAANRRLCIWCPEPKDMQRMIDILIAKGTLRAYERAECVHWSEVKEEAEFRHEDRLDMWEAEKMLREAERSGIAQPTHPSGVLPAAAAGSDAP
jgi:hypothetical protein